MSRVLQEIDEECGGLDGDCEGLDGDCEGLDGDCEGMDGGDDDDLAIDEAEYRHILRRHRNHRKRHSVCKFLLECTALIIISGGILMKLFP